MVDKISFVNSLRRSQTKEISFPFYVGSSPDPSTENMIVRIFLWFWGPSWRGREARTASPRAPMRTRKYKATTRSARCSYGLSSKWVRAKVSNSSPIENNPYTSMCGLFASRRLPSWVYPVIMDTYDGDAQKEHAHTHCKRQCPSLMQD